MGRHQQELEAAAGEGTFLLGNNKQQQQQPPIIPTEDEHSKPATALPASLYVLSGVTQPLLMTLCHDAGLADPKCQLYMLFYYLGPASVGLKLFLSNDTTNTTAASKLPSWPMMARAGGITIFDIVATAMNYTGASLAGPTIFAIVYSSVTVWTAIFSRLLLQRKLSLGQWLGIAIVFGGLAITAADPALKESQAETSQVAHGLMLVIVGSAMHGLTYVFCEVVMVVNNDVLEQMESVHTSKPMKILLKLLIGNDKQQERMTVTQNCAIQGINAVVLMFVWQLIYTLPRLEPLILEPMQEAGTTFSQAALILGMFAFANLVHAYSYFFTLRHFPGGATSAGVMKGMQAVLVFVVTDRVFCGRTGGSEMCFTTTKFISLLTVVAGVSIFGIYTERQHRLEQGQAAPAE